MSDFRQVQSGDCALAFFVICSSVVILHLFLLSLHLLIYLTFFITYIHMNTVAFSLVIMVAWSVACNVDLVFGFWPEN